MVTVLVVDDEPRIRSLLRLTLHGLHCALEAENGAEALRMAFVHRPDVILLDVAMPVLDGLSVCRALRAEPEFDSLGIIIVSAHATDDEAREAGADAHLPKPFRPLRLMSAIDEVVVQRQRRASAFTGTGPRCRDPNAPNAQ